MKKDNDNDDGSMAAVCARITRMKRCTLNVRGRNKRIDTTYYA